MNLFGRISLYIFVTSLAITLALSRWCYNWSVNDYTHKVVYMSSNDSILWRESAFGFENLQLNDTEVELLCSYNRPNLTFVKYEAKPYILNYEGPNVLKVYQIYRIPMEYNTTLRINWRSASKNPGSDDFVRVSIPTKQSVTIPGNSDDSIEMRVTSPTQKEKQEDLYLTRGTMDFLINIQVQRDIDLQLNFTVVKPRYTVSKEENLCIGGKLAKEVAKPFWFVLNSPIDRVDQLRHVHVERHFKPSITVLHTIYYAFHGLLVGVVFFFVNPWSWVLCLATFQGVFIARRMRNKKQFVVEAYEEVGEKGSDLV